ncbi:hypothetical protein LCGC14_0936460 [marine sediment metagenome]|uniref:Uncharacterized protein n=1 Tax=marine sediment metagenome TaxID=412755 RepID=A0A0F9NR07_9ZZZZ
MEKPRECFICGCTEDNPCMTDEGPCSWELKMRAGSICSACIVKLPPDPTRDKYPNMDLLIEKVCINCAHLIEAQFGGKDSYTCSKGRFDDDVDATRGAHHWFAWRGIKRPNKTVGLARRHCPDWKLHTRWQPKTSV